MQGKCIVVVLHISFCLKSISFYVSEDECFNIKECYSTSIFDLKMKFKFVSWFIRISIVDDLYDNKHTDGCGYRNTFCPWLPCQYSIGIFILRHTKPCSSYAGRELLFFCFFFNVPHVWFGEREREIYVKTKTT